MESKTKNKQSRAQIERMVARAFTGAELAAGDAALREMKEGWFNAAYDIELAGGRHVILKISPPQGAEVMQYEKNIMATEVAAMRLVRQNPAIPVPEIYAFDDAHDLCDSDYYFMEKMGGDVLEHVFDKLDPATRASAERQTGAIIREINRFPGDYFGYPGNPDLRAATWPEAFVKIMDSVLADGARKQAVYDYSYADLRAATLKHLSALAEITMPCLVHWDAWNPNFFITDGKITGIIDFERAFWAEPLMEAQFRPFSGEGITNALRGYGITGFTFAEEQRNHLYSLHLALVMNTECYYRNYDNDFAFNLSRDLMHTTMDWLQAQS